MEKREREREGREGHLALFQVLVAAAQYGEQSMGEWVYGKRIS
jgi:hypothetical protein